MTTPEEAVDEAFRAWDAHKVLELLKEQRREGAEAMFDHLIGDSDDYDRDAELEAALSAQEE